jgi:hypothetical protein
MSPVDPREPPPFNGSHVHTHLITNLKYAVDLAYYNLLARKFTFLAFQKVWKKIVGRGHTYVYVCHFS